MPYHVRRAPRGSWSGEYALSGNVNRSVDSFRQCVLEVRRMTSYLRKDSVRVGIIGFSLGGLVAHVAMAVEPFDAGVTIMSGGNNAKMVWEGEGAKYLKSEIEASGITQKQLSHIWAIIDPCKLAEYSKTKRILMMNGIYDKVLPRECAIELWMNYRGKAQLKWYQCGHMGCVFFGKVGFRDIKKFLLEA